MRKLFYFLAVTSLTAFVSCSDNDDIDSDTIVVIEDSTPSATIESSGFYVVNEDWFSHDNGTVNFFKNDGSIDYRVFREANPGQTLGVTTEFATIYGENIYFVSKQESRLVVADAKTLKQKAVLTDIGGDGRSFLGVNTKKGYIGTNKGVSLFDISNLTLGSTIPDISAQVGNMCLVGNRAFVLVQSKGIYVIDTTTDRVETLIEGSYNCMTQSKDGNIWAGLSTKLIQVNPYTLSQSEITLSGTSISSAWAWGSWNAGGLCASTQTNVIYWTSGKDISKYDIDKKELNTTFYQLGTDSENAQLAFYGAGLRVDPISDKLILTVVRNGWGINYSYNWIQTVTPAGQLEKTIEVKGDNGKGSAEASPTVDGNYYWFPALPFFEDVNAPEILLNQVVINPNDRKAICLSDKIVDADNMSSAIIKTITSENTDKIATYQIKADSLIIESTSTQGKTTFTLEANSNGKVVNKVIRIDVRN